jgi:hypothetical protein
VRAMKAQGLGASEIAKALKIGRVGLSGAGSRLICRDLPRRWTARQRAELVDASSEGHR